MKDIKDNKSESPKPIRKILNKKTPPKPPKFNIMWLYGIVILAFLLVPTLLSGGSGTPTTFKDVEVMLKQNDVEKLIAYKSGDLVTAEVYIKKESLSKPQYAKAGKDQRLFNTTNNGPQYTFTDASYESLKQSVANAQKDMPEEQKVTLQYEQGHESFLSNWLVQGVIMVILFAGVWIFIMRRMSGGSGGGISKYSLQTKIYPFLN